MSEYLLSIIGTILFSSVLIAILPEGKTTATVKNITKIVCLLAIIAPIVNITQLSKSETENERNSWGNFSQSVIQLDAGVIKYYSELRIKNVEESIAEELLEEFDVETVVDLQWESQGEGTEEAYSTEKIRITRIDVKFQKEYIEERKQSVWAYLTKNYCSEVKIE